MLELIFFNVGNVDIFVYGIVCVLIFGVLLFWLGRVFNFIGKDIICNYKEFDVLIKEVFVKFFEVVMFCVIFLLLLNIMGINLMVLVVFGGVLGVGFGFGL